MLNILTSSGSAAEIAVSVFASLAIMLISFPLRAYVQGMVAYRLGDRTAEACGRLTLNPIAHFDARGTLALLLFGLGWAKPMPIDYSRCKKVKPRVAMLLTTLAGPAVMLLIAYVLMIVYKIVIYNNVEILLTGLESVPYYIMAALSTVITYNIYLAVLNLLPIPPFGGSILLAAILPSKAYLKFMKFERILAGITLVLLFIGVLSVPLAYITNFITKGLYSATGFVEYFISSGV